MNFFYNNVEKVGVVVLKHRHQIHASFQLKNTNVAYLDQKMYSFIVQMLK